MPDGFGKIHCKKCFGCNVVLSRLESNQNLHGKKVKMFAGASGAAVVRGYTKEHGNVIIKSWCDFGGYKQHPETAAKHPLTCNEETQSKNTQCPIKGGIHAYGECNYKFLNALDKLTVDSNLTGVVPRTWTGSVKTFLPWDGHAVQGHKIDVRSQFYEVAKGYSIEAVYGSSVAQDTVEMFKNIKHEIIVILLRTFCNNFVFYLTYCQNCIDHYFHYKGQVYIQLFAMLLFYYEYSV